MAWKPPIMNAKTPKLAGVWHKGKSGHSTQEKASRFRYWAQQPEPIKNLLLNAIFTHWNKS